MNHKSRKVIPDASRQSSIRDDPKEAKQTDENKNQHVYHIIRQSWYKYSGSTTLHCVCHLGNKEYPWYRRIFWVLLFLALVGVFTMEVSHLAKRYFEYETVTKETVLFEKDPKFPAVTICNLNKIANSTVWEQDVRYLLVQIFMTYPMRMKYFDSLNPSYLNSVNLTEYFVTRQWDLNIPLAYCKWQQTTIDCAKYFHKVLTNYGVCTSFNSNTFVKENGKALRTRTVGAEDGLAIGLYVDQSNYFIGDSVAAGFKIVIHDQDVEPAVKQVGFTVAPGTTSEIAIKKTEMINLPSPVRAFGDNSCIDSESSDFINPLKYFDNYSYEACISECEIDYILQECGCRYFLSPGQQEACNAYDYVYCVREARANYSATGLDSCDCIMPCKYNIYKYQISTAYYPRDNYVESYYSNFMTTTDFMRKNMLELRLYYDSKLYTQKMQVLELSANDVYGALGGYMGLCFGASIGTLLELFEFLLSVAINCYKRKNSKTTVEKL